MNTKEKLQQVLDVIDGRAHPSTLSEILPAPGVDEENLIRMAVDYHIARDREKQGAGSNSRFRLLVTKTKEIHEGEEARKEKQTLHVTDWQPEVSQMSAPMLMAQVRQQFPDADISVERSYAS